MVKCPYCEEDIKNEVSRNWYIEGNHYIEYESTWNMQCPKCNKQLIIDVEVNPIFTAKKKGE